MGTCPQVFVVDSQASYINSMPPERKPRWASQLQKYLLLLVGLAMLGLIVEGFLIYNLYQKTKVRQRSACDCCAFVCLYDWKREAAMLGVTGNSFSLEFPGFPLRHTETCHCRAKHVSVWVVICTFSHRVMVTTSVKVDSFSSSTSLSFVSQELSHSINFTF